VIHERRSGKRLAYFSAAAAVTPAMRVALEQADCVFFDGTFWTSDELIALGLGDKRAEQMAHLPVGGKEGSLQALAGVRARRIYIHINNTNPLLRPGSPEREKVEAGGWEIAYDGMEVNL
jgi:pyrroloquinoline quinone biosynthesis protein B